MTKRKEGMASEADGLSDAKGGNYVSPT